MTVSTGFAATASADRYFQQLCRHWSHRFAARYADGHGEVPFSDTERAQFDAKPGGVAMARSFDIADAGFTVRFKRQQGEVFAEDKDILEAQQRSILANPELRLKAYNIDQGGVHARQGDNRFLDSLVGDNDAARHIPHIEYLRETGSEGNEMVMWLIMRGALGRSTRALHRHYHVPCSNTAIGHIVLEPTS